MNGLDSLREAVRAGKGADIKLVGDDLVIGSRKFSKDAESSWKASGGQNKGKFYKLSGLWFYWANHGDGYAAYIKKSREAKLAIISNLDTKDLLAYLKGEIETAKQIEKRAVEASAPPTKKQKTNDGSAKASRKAGQAAPADKAKRERPTAKNVLETILDNEVVSLNRKTIMDSSNKNFLSVIDLFTQAQKKEMHALIRKKALKEAEKALEKVKSQKYSDKTKSSHKKLSKEHQMAETKRLKKQISKLQETEKQKKIKGDPIIVVPASASSMITIHNARSLLEKGAFQPTMDIKKQGLAVKKGQKVVIGHPPQSRTDYALPAKFEIVDNCRKFSKDEWSRVVCTFTDGQAWQFKDWKYSTPIEVFAPQHSLGIHLYLDDRPIIPIVKTWNVQRLAISNKKRHLDRILWADFWRLLDEYMIVRRQEFVQDNRKGGS